MDFNNKFYGSFNFLGLDIWITQTLLGTWAIMAFLIIFALIVRSKLNSFDEVPTGGFQNFVETCVETMDNFVTSNMGEKYSYFGNWFFGLFCFIVLSNLSGLIGMRPPTADITTTAAFGISTFFLIHFMGIKERPKEYFKEYFSPHPVFFPINLVSEVAIPISLSFRMFGNIVGGLLIMGLVYNLFPPILRIGIPAVLHIYMDVFVGALQAFIFTILSMTFIRSKIGN